MVQLNEAYVIGLLSDLEAEVPRREGELRAARVRAASIDAELGNLIGRLDAAKGAAEQAAEQAAAAVTSISEHNARIAALHQEIASLKRRSDELKTEMDRIGPGAIQRRLRRDRAKLTVQIEDREAEITTRRAEVEQARAALQEAEGAELAEKDRVRLVTAELDKLQALLPSPYAYTGLFDHRAARAHCRLFLDHDVAAWRGELGAAIGLVEALHGELRAGKYRLDRNSELVGGRAMATAEAIYGAVALADEARAASLFALATDPALFFHQIFNVFRVWCLGLYLAGRRRELGELLRLHQFATGLRGGYAQVFIGLLTDEVVRVEQGLRAIAKHEWELWQDPALVRGAGVVNLGSVALMRLARARRLQVDAPGPTVPPELLAVVSPRRLAEQPTRR